MRAAYADERQDDDRAVLRRRIIGFLLAVAFEGLVIIVLLTMGPPKFGTRDGDRNPTIFQMTNVRDKDDAEKKPKERKRAAKVTKVLPPPPPTIPIPPPTPLGDIPGLIPLTREQFAAADIGKIKSQRAAVAEAGPDGEADDDSQLAGTGPNGEPLYQAEWYREPTEAQMAFYTKGLRPGSALIACKTASKYKVEDCQLLGEIPAGTGLARAVREASWQFLVRPPRKGGKALLGAWVRIRFDLTVRAAR